MGNTCLYGATGGRLFVNGRAGERFAVRNSMAQVQSRATVTGWRGLQNRLNRPHFPSSQALLARTCFRHLRCP